MLELKTSGKGEKTLKLKKKTKDNTANVSVKLKGLNEKEKQMTLDAVQKVLRRIQYKRKKENRQSLSHWISLK